MKNSAFFVFGPIKINTDNRNVKIPDRLIEFRFAGSLMTGCDHPMNERIESKSR